MCFWLCLDFACECKENVRDKVCGCEPFEMIGISLAACFAFASECGRLWTSLFSWMCMMFVNNNKSNFVFSAKLRLHVFWSCMTFSTSLWRTWMNLDVFERVWRVFGNGWWIRTCRIHPTVWNVWDGNGRELSFAPRPFQDGTAERRRHSTVHVHDSWLALPVFLCGKGSKGSAVTAVVFWVSCKFLIRSTRWRPTHLSKTCVRDLVVVIRFLRIFAW